MVLEGYWQCMTDVTGQQSGVLWEETIPVYSCSVAPTWGEKVEQVVSRLRWICGFVSDLFPDSGDVEVLSGGQAGTIKYVWWND